MHVYFKKAAITLAIVTTMPVAAQQRDETTTPTAATSVTQGKVNMAAFHKIMQGMFRPFQSPISQNPVKNNFLPSQGESLFKSAGTETTIPSRSFSFLGVRVPTHIAERTDCGKVKIFGKIQLGFSHPK